MQEVDSGFGAALQGGDALFVDRWFHFDEEGVQWVRGWDRRRGGGAQALPVARWRDDVHWLLRAPRPLC